MAQQVTTLVSHMAGPVGDVEIVGTAGNIVAIKNSCADEPTPLEDVDTASDTDDTASTSASGDSVVENPSRGLADSEDDNEHEDDGYGKVETTVGTEEDANQFETEAVSKEQMELSTAGKPASHMTGQSSMQWNSGEADTKQPLEEENSKPEGNGAPPEECRPQVNSGGAADSATNAEAEEVGQKNVGNTAASTNPADKTLAKATAEPSAGDVPAGVPDGGTAAPRVPRPPVSGGTTPVETAVCLAAAANDQQRRSQRPTLNNADTASEIVISALASVLGHLASLGCRKQRLTVFHATRVPQVSIEDYLKRIALYFPCSDECLVLGLVYIDRVLHLHPDFVVSGLSIHRLLVTAITLSAKFHNDLFFRNEHYAKVAGLKAQELTSLEARFLQLIDWRLHVQPEEYQRHLANVLAAYPDGLKRYQARNRVPGQ